MLDDFQLFGDKSPERNALLEEEYQAAKEKKELQEDQKDMLTHKLNRYDQPSEPMLVYPQGGPKKNLYLQNLK